MDPAMADVPDAGYATAFDCQSDLETAFFFATFPVFLELPLLISSVTKYPTFVWFFLPIFEKFISIK